MKKWLLLILLMTGCGSDSLAPTPHPASPPNAIHGPLAIWWVRVSYQDAPTTFTETQVSQLEFMLDDFVRRNSSDLAWTAPVRFDLKLPGTAAAYAAPTVVDQGSPLTPVQADCLAALPDPGAHRLFLLPATPEGPAVWVGYGGVDHQRPGFGWVTDLPFAPGDLLSLPIPHEFGHMLGLGHTLTGVMVGGTRTDLAADWTGSYADQQRRDLGWIP